MLSDENRKASGRERYLRKVATLEGREAISKSGRESKRRKRSTPEGRAVLNKANRECYRRKRSTPEGLEASRKAYAKNPEYRAFLNAKDRCENPRSPQQWKDYGGRGVRFLFESFEEFLAEVGRRPSPEYSLDRINPWGHYERGNVRWATKAQQELHKRGVLEELARLGPEGIERLLSFVPRVEFLGLGVAASDPIRSLR